MDRIKKYSFFSKISLFCVLFNLLFMDIRRFSFPCESDTSIATIFYFSYILLHFFHANRNLGVEVFVHFDSSFINLPAYGVNLLIGLKRLIEIQQYLLEISIISKIEFETCKACNKRTTCGVTRFYQTLFSSFIK